MKKLLMLVVLFISNGLLADLIIEGTHSVERVVKIVNTSKYPELTILKYISMTSQDPFLNLCVKVDDNTSLEKGYKFNGLYLTAIPTSLLDSYGKDVNLTELVTSLELMKKGKMVYMPLTSGYINVEDKYPMSREIYLYEITSKDDDNLTISLKKRIVTFNDGTPDQTIEY